MSELTTAPADTFVSRLPAAAPSRHEALSTYLGPADAFPSTLAELAPAELHVLHSRITRQLDREYRTDPAGPHPVTLDRAQALVAELDTREEFLVPAGPAFPAELQAGAPLASPGSGTAGEHSAGPGPAQATDDRADPVRSRRTPPAPPRQEKHAGVPSPARGEVEGEDQIRDAAEARIEDLNRLRPGDRIEVWLRGQLQCVGTVEEAAPALGVVWIREALDGYRRMVSTQDTGLSLHLARTSR